MPIKNELFRTINLSAPEIVEYLITHWGSDEVDSYIDDLLSDARGGTRPELTAAITTALAGLRCEHDREYPQYAVYLTEGAAEKLAHDPHFQTINTQFPRVGRRLLASWGHASFSTAINELLSDKRGGSRQGFPEEIGIALFKLQQLHDLEFPQFIINPTDLWSVNNKA